MPELPEVESIARKLKPDLVGRKILSADLRWARTLATPSPKKFAEQIRGQKILDVGRRAKYLDLRLSSFHLLIHLRMSGDLHIKDSANQPEKHDRLIIKLSGNKSLAFNDTRKFGRVWLVKDSKEIFEKLGPEPLSKDFTPQWLHAALYKKHRQLKPLLLDQSFLAGLGNIYADEALNIAKLHPLCESSSVTARQAERLHDAIRAVLNEGIRRNGASIDWVYRGGEFQNYFRAYDREGKPCKNCGAKIKRIVVGQRSTHYCPRCQRLR
ncbi:MAG: bifunctional DNA-formamidopyrimidine glycosylase/DNA-(apurinic or apyrimidinic site) lyase [Anaerolineales bacterium]|nr:bifunctional DNA-formamidopyrimidine glycosylase/DNA-(apurinic or apyrimidinic site) lyase [Anaerolineales bacterium]